MLSFLIFLVCMLAACLAFLVWSFWPVLHGKDFTRFERAVEEQERREFSKALRTADKFITAGRAQRNANY